MTNKYENIKYVTRIDLLLVDCESLKKVPYR